MKNLCLLVSLLAGASCNMQGTRGSGHIITQQRTADASFMAIRAEGPIKVQLVKGSGNAITVEADDNIINHIETKVSGETLKVRLRDVTEVRDVTIRVTVTAAMIRELNVSAAAQITSSDSFSADLITLKANSAASLNVAVDAPEVDAEAGSAGRIKVSGRTKSVKADAGSAATINASELLAENANADASSGATVQVSASVSITATAGSGGSVQYIGHPANVVKNESSGGAVSGN